MSNNCISMEAFNWFLDDTWNAITLANRMFYLLFFETNFAINTTNMQYPIRIMNNSCVYILKLKSISYKYINEFVARIVINIHRKSLARSRDFQEFICTRLKILLFAVERIWNGRASNKQTIVFISSFYWFSHRNKNPGYGLASLSFKLKWAKLICWWWLQVSGGWFYFLDFNYRLSRN